MLSGTTWKGTRLRIGEAKPDYAQRLVTSIAIHAQAKSDMDQAGKTNANALQKVTSSIRPREDDFLVEFRVFMQTTCL